MAKVQINANNCWVWTGGRKSKGYGAFYFQNTGMRAHRAAWILFVGPIEDGLLVCHHCDNPPCVNPEHLFLGTALDNRLDSVAKGRSRVALNPFHRKGLGQKGVYNGNAKLTLEDVEQIRKRREEGEFLKTIGKDYGIATSHVWNITKGHKWE